VADTGDVPPSTTDARGCQLPITQDGTCNTVVLQQRRSDRPVRLRQLQRTGRRRSGTYVLDNSFHGTCPTGIARAHHLGHLR
jgi:hypothetical protein